MQVATSVIHHDFSASAEAARRAEAAGYDAVLSMENQQDPFLPLAVAATATERVQLATSIALAFTRSPVTTAYVAHDLHVASKGRFMLGLGSQVRGHNVRRFSVPWTAPAPRMRECIELIRATWRCWELGETLDYAGEHYQVNLMPPNFCPPASGLHRIPIMLAAVGPAMLRLAGSHCDAVALHPFCTRQYVETVVMPEIDVGLARSGRSREQLQIQGGGFLATGADDEAVARRIEWVRHRIAFYGSTPSYHGVLEQHGLEALGAKLHHMSRNGQWKAMPAEISDDTVELFAAIGRHDQIAAAIAARLGGLADVMPETNAPGEFPGLPPDLIHDLGSIPIRFGGFATPW